MSRARIDERLDIVAELRRRPDEEGATVFPRGWSRRVGIVFGLPFAARIARALLVRLGSVSGQE
jgi:hypothetical protein